jgi:hypothetical protein
VVAGWRAVVGAAIEDGVGTNFGVEGVVRKPTFDTLAMPPIVSVSKLGL